MQWIVYYCVITLSNYCVHLVLVLVLVHVLDADSLPFWACHVDTVLDNWVGFNSTK